MTNTAFKSKMLHVHFRRLLLLTLDVSIAIIALPLSLFIRLDFGPASTVIKHLYLSDYAFVGITFALVSYGFKTQRVILRLANLYSALRVGLAVLCASFLSFLYCLLIRDGEALPRSTFLIHFLLLYPACVGIRFLPRIFHFRKRRRSENMVTLVYGAGVSTDRLLPIVLDMPEFGNIVGLIDDDLAKIGGEIQGLRVLGGRKKLRSLVAKLKVEQILLSMPSATGSVVREILLLLKDLDLMIKVLPGPDQFLGKNNFKQLTVRDLNIEDLLRRPPRNIDQNAISELLADRSILITGAGGSIGSELTRQIARTRPKNLLLNDLSEFALYSICENIKNDFPDITVQPILGDIGMDSLCEHVFKTWPIDIVFHACAYKHVPLVEKNISIGVLNNIRSALTVFKKASAYAVDRVVLISSDKAVLPPNSMGASKRFAELLALYYAKEFTKTKFSIVRFGNVLGSSGSVIPKFIEQIKSGGPITITHPKITRYFMLTQEAVALVLQASTINHSGRIFLLNMGDPVKIFDMAQDLIRLMGRRLDKDIKVIFTGLSEGEKLYEELKLPSEVALRTYDYFEELEPQCVPQDAFLNDVNKLISCAEEINNSEVKRLLFESIAQFDRLSDQESTSISQEFTANTETVHIHHTEIRLPS